MTPAEEITRRRTFAIISHPDAGKTTLTEKLLLFGGAIQMAGTVKGRKAARHATSDWMRLEQQRGISVTSSVMQFPYRGRIVNLLDTPGHEDFSEDTYRTLTAVDSALMVIDCAKGVEERTIKLMEVCRLRDTPIMTFINKLDRDGRAPIELLDEIERVLGIHCAPVTWPIGMGRELAGIYHLRRGPHLRLRAARAPAASEPTARSTGSRATRRSEFLGERAAHGPRGDRAGPRRDARRSTPRPTSPAGRRRCSSARRSRTSASKNCCGSFVEHAPGPRAAPGDGARRRAGGADADRLRVQDPGQHGSRPPRPHRLPAHLLGRLPARHAALPRAARQGNPDRGRAHLHGRDRQQADEAWAGDIIGLHNHGTINIGDTFTEGEPLTFTGIPNFAPELFRRAVLKDPLRMKALQKGLDQLCEEGATQLFRPLRNNDLILGAIGPLQFDVVAFRLADEYGVTCAFEPINVVTARWIAGGEEARLRQFRERAYENLALDHAGELVYLAPTRINLGLTLERWPELAFRETREHLAVAS